jgi:hypothetical protein
MILWFRCVFSAFNATAFYNLKGVYSSIVTKLLIALLKDGWDAVFPNAGVYSLFRLWR